MNENAHHSCVDEERASPASSSLLSSPISTSTQTWPLDQSPPRPTYIRDPQEGRAGWHMSPPFRLYEELFCPSQSANTLVPLAPVTSSAPQSNVVKQGYLGKTERNHRRYFVLRAGSHTGPSRLEWYRSQEKFKAVEKSSGETVLFGSNKRGVMFLRCCLGVSRVYSSRKGHTVALYAKDQTLVLVVEDQQEQEEWYLAMKKLMEEEQKDEERRQGCEEDDGYCTLPPAAFFKEVWPVMVKPKDLGCSRSLTGESRLCLTASSLILFRAGVCSDLPSVTIPLLSVRRFGHLDGSFFLELGRTAPNGPGEIWMEARDRGNAAVAQHIHEMVREAVRSLRALPDFSRSPTSNQNHLTLMASKRYRPKYKDKPMNLRPLGPRLALEIQTSPTKCDSEPRKPEPCQSPRCDTGCYMEMKTDPVNKKVNKCRLEGWEPGEAAEGPGYMMMSPQVSQSPSVKPRDDYVTMVSPRKHDRTAHSSLCSSFNSCDGDSPPHSSFWLMTSASQRTTIMSSGPQEASGQEQMGLSAQTRAPSSSSAGYTGPVIQPVIPNPGPPVRRSRLFLCLPSCLRADDR